MVCSQLGISEDAFRRSSTEIAHRGLPAPARRNPSSAAALDVDRSTDRIVRLQQRARIAESDDERRRLRAAAEQLEGSIRRIRRQESMDTTQALIEASDGTPSRHSSSGRRTRDDNGNPSGGGLPQRPLPGGPGGVVMDPRPPLL